MLRHFPLARLPFCFKRITSAQDVPCQKTRLKFPIGTRIIPFIGQPLTKALLARGWQVLVSVRKADSPQARAVAKLGAQ